MDTLVPQVTQLSSGVIALSWQEKLRTGGYNFAMALREGTNWLICGLLDYVMPT